MMSHLLKEEVVFIKHYPALCDTIIDIDRLLPYFVQENVIGTDDLAEINAATPSTKKLRVQKLLTYISGPLKNGNTQGFYIMLSVMENHGNQATQQLSKQITSAIGYDCGNDREANQYRSNLASKDGREKTFLWSMIVIVLLLVILFVGILGILAIMDLRVLKYCIPMQSNAITDKHTTCDCNRNEDDTVVQVRDKEGRLYLSNEFIDNMYPITNTWYLQLFIKTRLSINHFQVAPAFFSARNDTKTQFIFSKPFFTFEGGHFMCLSVYLNGHDDEDIYGSVYLHLLKGPHDDKLEQSGHFPLKGMFEIELLNPLYDYNHHSRMYIMSSDSCIECTKRVLHEGGMAKGYGGKFILQNDCHDYYKNDTLYFRVSYYTCVSCTYFQHELLYRLLFLCVVLYMIDSLIILDILKLVESDWGLMDIFKYFFHSNRRRDLNWQFLIVNTSKKLVIVGILVVAFLLIIVIWEFTGLFSYDFVNITTEAIFRIYFLSLFYQLVNTIDKNKKSVIIISPVLLIIILLILDKTILEIIVVFIIVMTSNFLFYYCNILKFFIVYS